jgi:hypothetical protein
MATDIMIVKTTAVLKMIANIRLKDQLSNSTLSEVILKVHGDEN